MKAIAITNKGIEDIAALEVKELIGADSKITETVVSFEASQQDLALLCYKAQSLARVLEFITEIEVNNFDDFDKFEKLDFKGKGSFVVRCLRVGEHDFSSQDVDKRVGEIIFNKTKRKVDLTNADVIYFIYIYENKAYLGIDYSGVDLSKREYKVFTSPKALKATITYALIRIADYKSKEVLLDTFSLSGEVPIEAAMLVSGFPVNFYNKEKLAFNKFLKFDFNKVDKKIKKSKTKVYCYDPLLRNTKAAQKNAKIAGIDKQLNFGRADIEWLDTKFKKNSVDKIVAQIPEPSQSVNEKDVEKLYKEFFYQIEFILKKGGTITAIARNPSLFKKMADKFEVINERKVSIGQDVINVVVLKKK